MTEQHFGGKLDKNRNPHLYEDPLSRNVPNDDNQLQFSNQIYGTRNTNDLSRLPPAHLVGPIGPIVKQNYFGNQIGSRKRLKSKKETKKGKVSKSHSFRNRPFGMVSQRIPQPTATPQPSKSSSSSSDGTALLQKEQPKFHKNPLMISRSLETPQTPTARPSPNTIQPDVPAGPTSKAQVQSSTKMSLTPSIAAITLEESAQINEEAIPIVQELVPSSGVPHLSREVSVPDNEEPKNANKSQSVALGDQLSVSLEDPPVEHVCGKPSADISTSSRIIDKVMNEPSAKDGIIFEEIEQKIAAYHPCYEYLRDRSFSNALKRVLVTQPQFDEIKRKDSDDSYWCKSHFYEEMHTIQDSNRPMFSESIKKAYMCSQDSSQECIVEFEVPVKDLAARDVLQGAFLARPNPVSMSIHDICKTIDLIYGDLPFPDLETEVEHVLKTSSVFTGMLMCGSKRYILNDSFIRSCPLRVKILQDHLRMEILKGDHEVISSFSFLYPQYTVPPPVTKKLVAETYAKKTSAGQNITNERSKLREPDTNQRVQDIQLTKFPACTPESRPEPSLPIAPNVEKSKDNLGVELAKEGQRPNSSSMIVGDGCEKDGNEDESSADESSAEKSSEEESSEEESSEEEADRPQPNKRPLRKTRQPPTNDEHPRFTRWKARILNRSDIISRQDRRS